MYKSMFSIIIPVYKVEKYLNICVESVLKQSEADYEVILVDDGSPDNCGHLCDRFAQIYDKVKVIHKVNGGLSSARNAGLDVATGQYIIFLDSDDLWDCVEALADIKSQLIESEADVLIFPAKRFYEDSGKTTNILHDEIQRNKVVDKNIYKSIEYMLEKNIFRAAAWNKVIRKEMIDSHCMRFREGYLSEDMDWCADILLYTNKFDFYKNPFYLYRQQRHGSITAIKSEKLVTDKLYMCLKGYKLAMDCNDKVKGILLANYYAYEYAVTLGVSSSVKNKSILSQMEKLQILLRYDLCYKVKMVNRLRSVVGYKLARHILCLFVKIKK